MSTNTQLPSAFYPDMTQRAATDAPGCVSRITASVLGTLIGAQVLRLEEQPGETIEMIDRLIAEAVNAALDAIDMEELQRAVEARFAARREAERALYQKPVVNEDADRAAFDMAFRATVNQQRAAAGLPPLGADESPYSDNLKRLLAALDTFAGGQHE